MTLESFPNQYNWELIQQMEQRYNQDYHSVDPSWQGFFAGFHLAQESPRPFAFSPQIGIVNLIDAYRSFGHLQAHLDPLSDAPPPHEDLSLDHFGFSDADLDKSYDTSYLTGMPRTATLRQLVQALRETYSRSIGVEYMHIMDVKIRRWLQDRMEPSRNQGGFSRDEKLHILQKLHESEIFEDFLHKTFQGQKRFSLEGAETLIPLLDHIVDCAADASASEMVFGMAHRGRLNVLATILCKPHSKIFTEFEENYLPNSSGGDGDVKYHLGFSHDHVSRKGNKIHLMLVPNPSHLEAVNPVVEGRARASQHFTGDENRNRVVPLLIHGDAAIAGQGVVTETLNLSQLQGYRTGGTLHVVINNQIGFTTRPADARSTRYCTDVAKMIEVPIFHVNAEDPEAVLFVAGLAVEFRQAFKKDVFIDMYCYRKYGHNEGDEPAYTNPDMCSRIKTKQPLSTIYAEKLMRSELLTTAENKQIADRVSQQLKDERETQKKEAAMVGVLQELMRKEDNSYVRLKCQKALHEMNASVETF